MTNIYNDPLWGETRLEEPVLAALVRSAPVQRLRGIHQAGASCYLFPHRGRITRFDHSLGAMRLLAMLGAPLEEQVAGLLHDVPHTAFSHTVDIVFPSNEHNFHERFQHAIIADSDIPAILGAHGVPIHAATEPDRYPLLEQPLPGLCADRIDYTLRDMHALGRVTIADAGNFLDQLIPTPGGLVVGSTEAASWFAGVFAEANRRLWTGPQEAGAYWALAGAIRRAYALSLFTDADLFSTDDEAMRKLRAAGDETIAAYLSLLTPGTRFHKVEGPGPCFTTHMKHRAIDPAVQELGWSAPRRLSDIQGVDPAPGSRTMHYRLWSEQMPDILRDAAPRRGGS